MQNRRPPGYENKMWNGRLYPGYEDKMLRMSSQPVQKTTRRPRQNLFQYHYQKRLAEQQAARERQERLQRQLAANQRKWERQEVEYDRIEREDEKKRQEWQKQRDLHAKLARLETLVSEYEESPEGKAAQSVYDQQQLIKRSNSLEYRQEMAAKQATMQADRMAQLARTQRH